MTPMAAPADLAPHAVQRERGEFVARPAFFRYHGIWAPGVRLLRSMGFARKALCITLAFLVPIATLTWTVLQVEQHDQDRDLVERRAVHYQSEVLAALRLALAHQFLASPGGARAGGSAAALQAAHESADAQFKRLQDVDTQLGTGLATAAANKALREAAKALEQGGGSAQAVQGQHAKYIDALLDLSQQVTDSSGLTLDPELEMSSLISTTTVDGPDLLAQLGHLRAIGVNALVAGKIDPGQVRQVIRTQPLMARRIGDIKASLTKVAAALPELAATLHHGAAFKQVDEFLARIDTSLLAAEGPKGDAAEFAALGTQAIDSMGEMLARGTEQLDALLAVRAAQLNNSRNAILTCLLLSLLLAAYLFRAFYMVLNGGLREVERHLSSISEGDLTTHPVPWGNDEPARLMRNLQALQDSVRGMVLKVRRSAHSVVASSAEVSRGSQDLSARTEQAAASLEKTAAAMEQLESTVRQTADNAAQSARLAAENSKVAEQGGLVIAEVVTTMQAIDASSRKISDIIGTIDSIAFQTNILALNAAVEAARAGEQGRGFAVVASEVRALAQRSAAAAREIKSLIGSSVQQVASGTRVVQGAGQTMHELVANARRMNDLAAEISTAASQQSAGISEVGQAVQDMDRMTQQNAALVEQTSASAMELNSQATQLIGEVGQFRLPEAA